MNRDKHISSAFDRDLETIQAMVVKMGGMVEAAITDASSALDTRDEDLADDVLCSTLAQENGTYTGELSGAPVAGDARARMLASFARKRNVDLSRSYAYADAISDLPMLEAVGHPVAVNPDRRLRSAAAKRGWQIRDWGKDRVAKKV